MAKQERVLPARKPGDRSRDDDSMLLRSAESLGRVIGALQRQLDGVNETFVALERRRRGVPRQTADRAQGHREETHQRHQEDIRQEALTRRAPAFTSRPTPKSFKHF